MSQIDAWIEAHVRPIHGFLVLGPLVIGAYPITGFINPLWGSLFGFPLYAAAAGHPVYGPHPWTEAAAFLLWPLVMIAAMAWASGKLLRSPRLWRTPLVILWAVSAFAVLPFQTAMDRFQGWPIYGAFE